MPPSSSSSFSLAIPVGDAIWDCRCSFFFSFFSATILSGPYLWNRYSQRLEIECAAWSCGLVVHCCLPSNSLRYFFIFLFFFSAKILSGRYLWNRYSQRFQIECAAWSCGLVVHCCLPSNSLCYFFYLFIFFFCHDFVRAISLEPLLAETPNCVCSLVLRSNFALLLTIQFASLFFIFYFFFTFYLFIYLLIIFIYFFFRHDFVRAISLEPLLAETPN